MMLVRVTAPARRDIASALAQSRVSFGDVAHRRYNALIKTALRDLAEDPVRPGSKPRSDLGDGFRSFHLVHSQRWARTSEGSVHSPRHVIVYRMSDAEAVSVLRVLHDAMEPRLHLP